MRPINFFLGGQNEGFWGGGQKVYVEKVYVLLRSPNGNSNFGEKTFRAVLVICIFETEIVTRRHMNQTNADSATATVTFSKIVPRIFFGR